jgi:glycosyltransferase involved in cell wall biosynthesis
MKIAIVTMWFNEAFLAPLFFRHYEGLVDRICVILDDDSDDETEAICRAFGADVIKFHFPDGMDDDLKIEQYNKVAGALPHDWILGLDADEFLHQPEKARDLIEGMGHEFDFIRVEWWQMYQHETEDRLNRVIVPFDQRRHGDRASFIKKPGQFKPCIVKNEKPFKWMPGCHELIGNLKEAGFILSGAHWANADCDLAIKRRIAGRKNRMSQVNKHKGYTTHNFNVTEQEIKDLCDRHRNDPKLF